MKRCVYYIGIGANKGNRKAAVRQALQTLNENGRLLRVSSLYESAPYGVTTQPAFINAVAEWSTPLHPTDVLHWLKKTEIRLGRTPSVRWGPREIDLDIIEYNGPTLRTKQLNIPHTDYLNRRFVLLPLQEIAPDFHSREGVPIRKLLNDCPDTGLVQRLEGSAYAANTI